MFEKANPARDPFTFSLRGMAAINSYAVATVVANDQINKARDRRLARSDQHRQTRPDLAMQVEAVLARYFAPGRCQQA